MCLVCMYVCIYDVCGLCVYGVYVLCVCVYSACVHGEHTEMRRQPSEGGSSALSSED